MLHDWNTGCLLTPMVPRQQTPYTLIIEAATGELPWIRSPKIKGVLAKNLFATNSLRRLNILVYTCTSMFYSSLYTWGKTAQVM